MPDAIPHIDVPSELVGHVMCVTASLHAARRSSFQNQGTPAARPVRKAEGLSRDGLAAEEGVTITLPPEGPWCRPIHTAP
jgi:hypothetical protein